MLTLASEHTGRAPGTQEPRTSVSYIALHPLVTLYQVIVETYIGVLCSGTKNDITVPAKVTQVTLPKKYIGTNGVLRVVSA